MKHPYMKLLLTVLISMVCTNSFAHDIAVANSDGKTIYYNFTNNNTELAVTYQGSSYTEYSNEYSGNVVIPESVTYNGNTYNVTSIENAAFYSCTGLTSVIIPNSVTSIGNSTFNGCSGLTSVTISNSVTKIGDLAFRGCSGLTSVTIPKSVTSIRLNAFYNCTGLTTVKVENEKPVSIATNTFSNRANATLYVPAGSKEAYMEADYWKEFQNIVEYINFADENVKAICVQNWDTNGDGELSPDEAAAVTNLGWVFQGSAITSFDELQYFTGLTSIYNSAFFNCSHLTLVTIPNSVTRIDNYAFNGCSGLTSVTIPNSVTSIGSDAFLYCSGLTSIVVESGNTVYDSRDNCNAIIEIATNTLVVGCKNTNIPNSVTSIGLYAFLGCSELTSVTIPSSVTSIGQDAFSHCSSLTSVHISDLATWCNISFSNAYSNPLYYAHHLYLNGEEVTELVIPEGVSSIGQYAFYHCSELTSVTIPNSVTSIDGYAFFGCSSLTSVAIPNSVTNIGSYAFYGCSVLTTVTIPNSVTTIGERTFASCTSLTSVTIPNSVTIIGTYAFQNCSSLTLVTIPNSVTSIGTNAFNNCSSLTYVTIPNSVTSIGTNAFYNCSNLSFVKVGMERPVPIASNTFSNRRNAILYVPRGSKNTYKSGNYWKQFKEIVEYDPITVLADNSEVEPPSYPVPMDVKVQRTIKGGEWSTICLPFAMTGTQVAEALGSVELADFGGYRVTKIGNKTTAILVNFTPVDPSDGMEANHPYIIRIADDIEEFTVQDAILAPDEENAQTAFTTTEDGQEITKGHFIGTYHAQTVVPADNLFISANKFYYSTGKTKMQAYRAYFDLADRLDRDQAASAKITFMFSDSSTDRIEGLEVQHAVSSAVFDLGGRKVADNADGIQRLPKGVYIVNGKKVVR